MATEQGIVIAANGPAPATARVKTVQSSACKSCSSRDQCGTTTQGKEREIDAINLVDAHVGDLIQISMDNAALLKMTFLLYLFPILCMLFGGIIGNVLSDRLDTDPSTTSAIAAIVFFVAAVCIVRLRAGRMALRSEYRPKITRILHRGEASGEAPDPCGQQVTNHT